MQFAIPNINGNIKLYVVPRKLNNISEFNTIHKRIIAKTIIFNIFLKSFYPFPYFYHIPFLYLYKI